MLNRLKTRLKILSLVTVMILVSGCGGPLSLLTGGGPNVGVAANTQIGRTNSQTVGTTQNVDQRLENVTSERVRQSNDSNKVQADQVQTVVVNEVPVWVILLLILGWLFPSPNEIGRYFRGLFRKRDT